MADRNDFADVFRRPIQRCAIAVVSGRIGARSALSRQSSVVGGYGCYIQGPFKSCSTYDPVSSAYCFQEGTCSEVGPGVAICNERGQRLEAMALPGGWRECVENTGYGWGRLGCHTLSDVCCGVTFECLELCAPLGDGFVCDFDEHTGLGDHRHLYEGPDASTGQCTTI